MYYHFANVATTMFFQWAWVVIFKFNQSLLSCRKILIIMSVAYFFRCIGDCKRSTVMLIKSIKGANKCNYPLHIAFFYHIDVAAVLYKFTFPFTSFPRSGKEAKWCNSRPLMAYCCNLLMLRFVLNKIGVMNNNSWATNENHKLTLCIFVLNIIERTV